MRRFLFLCVLCLGWGSFASADLKIAVADVNIIFESFSEASSLMEEVRAKQQSIREKFISEKAAIESKYGELEKKKGILSEDAFKEKLADLSNEAASIEKSAAKSAADVESEYMSRVENIGKKVKLFIDEYAVQKNFDLVLNSSQALYYSNSVSDITGDIVEKLNAKVDNVAPINSSQKNVSSVAEKTKKKSSKSKKSN